MADRIRPFRGTSPFGDSEFDRIFFSGRDEEIDQLTSEILASSSLLTVLFGRSGLGKTSLINAGVLGRLRERRRFPVVTRLTSVESGEPFRSEMEHGLLDGNIGETLISQVRAAASNAGISITQTSVDELGVASIKYLQDLWSFFAFSRFTLRNRPLRPVLIIDQFEELFSRFTPHARNVFIEQFSDFVRNRTPEDLRRDAERQLNGEKTERLTEADESTVSGDEDSPLEKAFGRESNPLSGLNKEGRLAELVYGDFGHEATIVIVVREDSLSQLERLKGTIPNIFGTTFRLLPLTTEQAREAIVLPPSRLAKFGGEPFSFEEDAVTEILEFLQRGIVDEGESAQGAIEPLQLQILCADLDERRARAGKNTISKSDLCGRKGMQRVISNYYDRVMTTLPWIRLGWNGRRVRPSASNLLIVNFPRAAARYLCETQLITPQGRRDRLSGSFIEPRSGVEVRDLQQLVNAYLLRSEPRLHEVYYELSHDSLVGTLLEHRWRGQLARGVIIVWLVTLLAAMPLAYIAFSSPASELAYSWYVERLKPGYEFDVTSRLTKPETRSEAVRWLSRHGKTFFDLSNLDLNYVNLHSFDGLRPVDVSESLFTNAQLKNVDFEGASLGNAKFRKATIEDASFRGARLRGANFTRAGIDKTNFSDADLSRATFNKAKLRGIDFSEAELHYATFSGADFADTPNLNGSSWWTASGWRPEEIERFRQLFSLKNYHTSRLFKEGLKEREDGILRANNAAVLASGLNEYAWWCATSGFQLDIAEERVRRALELHANTKDYLTSTILDTLAYILMQKAALEDDLEQKTREEAAQRKIDMLTEAGQKIKQAILDAQAKGDGDDDEEGEDQGERYFKYSWVLNKLDRPEEAQRMMEIAIDLKKYEPSHELVLLPGMLQQYREFMTPVITSTEPGKLRLNSPGGLKVIGRNFQRDCTASIEGKPRAVEWLSRTELRVTLLAEDVATPGNIQLIVINPNPTGAASAPAPVYVQATL